MKTCECGCGRSVGQNRFVSGHNMKGLTREKSRGWKGGERVHSTGHVSIYMPEHHRAWSTGYVKRALLVAETKYGRPILSSEVIHHINGNKTDDRPENLEVLANGREHRARHNRERRNPNSKLTDDQVRQIRTLCGTFTRAEVARNFGVSAGTISQIALGYQYKHVSQG